MDIVKLRAFLTVAKLKSISEAARELNYTQPAVSAQIRDLENILGITLFEKSGRKLRLSEPGRIVLPYVERLLRDYDLINSAIPQALDSSRAYLRIGASSLPGVHLVPQLLADFGRSFSDICISLSIEKANRIERMVLDRQIDIGFIGRKVEYAPRTHLNEYLVKKDSLVAIVSSSHPLAGKKSISLDELSRIPLILPHRDVLTRRSVEERFHQLGYSVDLAFEVSNTEAIKRMVTCNLGASVLCQSSVQKEVDAGWLSALLVDELDLSRFIYIISRKTEKIPPGFDDFLQFAIASFSKNL